MAFDVDDNAATKPADVPGPRVSPHDLEVLVTCLEVAGIMLSDSPAASFTKEQLYAEARSLAGHNIPLYDRDLEIVFPRLRMFRRIPGGLFALA